MKRTLTVLAAILCWSLFSQEEYNFYLISDTHFGALSTFGANPPLKLQRKGSRADRAVPLFHAMFAEMAKRADKQTAFVIHTGDVIEGNAASKAAHIQQFSEADKLLKQYFRCPLYMVRGNHESSGKFGLPAYREYIAPTIAANAQCAAGTVNYTVKHGPDVFIFVDAYTPGWRKYIDRELASLSTPPRYLFIVLHPDQLPHPRPEVPALCRKLGKYNGIILSGHTHRTRRLGYTRDGGTVTQFSVGSHLNAPARVMRYRKKDTDMANFLTGFRKLRVRTPAQIEFFEREIMPYLSGYEEHHDGSGRFFAQGYAKLHVSDAGIVAEIQSGDLTQEPFRITILERKDSREVRK